MNETKVAKIDQFCRLGKAIIETEAQAVYSLINRIDHHFSKACHYLLNCEGRIVVIGMGKSGHIGGKIAATLASTGSPAFFVHPGEASHGDLGMITRKDVVLAISYSGETNEIVTIFPLIKRQGVPLISITGNPNATIAQMADVHLNVSVKNEACPLGLAPTASTTATLAMGDALAIALLETRGFTKEDFALSHPGGSLGRRLLLHVDDIMRTGKDIPRVNENANLRDALVEVTEKRMGMTAVLDNNHKVIGIFTDGDLRRTLDKEMSIHDTKISEVMTRHCKTIKKGLLAAEALTIMENCKINGLIIADDDNHIIGALSMHDLLRAGVM